jgi:GTPase SAR1 family protein
MSQDNAELRFKISFVGDISAGKTTLIYRATDTAQPAPMITIGLDFLIKIY